MATSRSADPIESLEEADTGLITQEEEAILRRVERSRVWRLLRDAMAWERENLFREMPLDGPTLWKTWGKIELLGRLLQDGPRNVIWYTRFMRQKEEAAAAKRVPEAERIYDPEPALSETPEFDM